MKKPIYKILLPTIFYALLLSHATFSSDITMQITEPFTKVIVSEGIDLILSEGDTQMLNINYLNVKREDIITEIKGKTLKIHLKGCKRGCNDDKYANVNIQASLTYQVLEKLVVMGDNDILHQGYIGGKRFTFKAYGDNRIHFTEIHSEKFKTSLYGDNELSIDGGKVERIKIKSFGDQHIKLSKLACFSGKVHAFGDNKIDLQIQDKLNLTMLGDASIHCQGDAWIDKKIVLGDLSLSVRR